MYLGNTITSPESHPQFSFLPASGNLKFRASKMAEHCDGKCEMVLVVKPAENAEEAAISLGVFVRDAGEEVQILQDSTPLKGIITPPP